MLTNHTFTHAVSTTGRARRTMAMAIALLTAGTTFQAAEDKRPMASLSVFVYDYGGVPAPVLTEATRTAERIFREAGIEVTWTIFDAERLARGHQESESDKGVHNAMFVHLLSPAMVESRRSRSGVLGEAVPGSQFAWILTSRAEHLARTNDLDFGSVLGHVVAHEMGHLLLPPPSHALTGIMGASLNLPALARGGLRFNSAEADRIRARLVDGFRATLPAQR